MFGLELENLFHRKLLVHMTGSLPQQHVPSGQTVDVSTQILIRTEDDGGVLGERFNDLARVAAGYHHVGDGLCGSGGVDITNHGVAGMCLDKRLELVGRTALGQRTRGVEVGYQHLLVGTEYLVGLAHEVNAAHDDNLSVGGGSLLRQCQAVSHEVGDVLNVVLGVIVSHDDGILLFAHPAYLSLDVCSFGDWFVDKATLLPFFFYHNVLYKSLLMVVGVFGIVYRIVQSAALFPLDGLPCDEVSHVDDVAQFADVSGGLDAFEQLFGLLIEQVEAFPSAM